MNVRPRVLLLAAQGFAFGLLLAWVTVPANTIFLDRFGSNLLPVTYLGAALAGAGTSVALASALRRRPLAAVAGRILVGVATALAGIWLVVALAGATWLSFPVLVVLPIALPVGFMFVVGQAGMLLDVRVLKVLYPRVIAGFALGFTVGGLAAGPLLGILGGIEGLFAAAAAAAVVLLAVVHRTVRSFPVELSVLEQEDEGGDAASSDPITLRSLAANRLVVLVMAFQMLSQVESQWLDYLVYSRAAARYPDPTDLATFVGRFSAIAYGADILFLLLVAGVVLRRFGLRLGLSANPAAVMAMAVSVVVASAVQGSGATLVFVLVVAARVTDMVLSDGTTRTSVGAAYQAIPGPQRLAAQSTTESLAVPVAIGISGAVLLVVQATTGTAGPTLLVLVAIVVAMWLGCAIAIYRTYRQHLLAGLRHRFLEPESLVLDEHGSLEAVDRLLASGDPRDVRLGVDLLADAGHEGAAVQLADLVRDRLGDGHEVAHGRALRHLGTLHREHALTLAADALGHPHPVVRAAALETLVDLDALEAAHGAEALLHDPDPEVQVAAAAAIGRAGDDHGRRLVVDLATELAASPDPASRTRAAALAGAGALLPAEEAALVGRLLGDADPTVAVAALDALSLDRLPELAPLVLPWLEARAAAATAAAALARSEGARAQLARVLDPSGAGSTEARLAAVRALRDVGGPDAWRLLREAADQPDRDVGLAVLRAIAATNDAATNDAPRPTDDDPGRDPGASGAEDGQDLGGWASEQVAADLAHAERIAEVRSAVAGLEGAPMLLTALDDELALARDRVLAGLSIRYGADALDRVAFQLDQESPRVQAMALEWLDVTLQGPDRPAIALLERAGANAGGPRQAGSVLADVLRDLVEDPHGVWRRPWLAACTLLAIARSPGCGMEVADFRGFTTERTGWAILLETRDALLDIPEATAVAGGT